ncbi:MAG TPA: ABC transporter substrate binding protein [Candidatus Competibacter sp.]|nr:ABC transporter substrate binding protein [Candidatus Competibacter sp.]
MKFFMNFNRLFFVFFILLFVETGWPIEASTKFNYQPVTKAGKKWRIAYYQGGASSNYYPYLFATVKGLINLGWIEKGNLPDSKNEDTKELWDWLAKNLKSDYINFVADAYYSADWNPDTREGLRKSIIDRLNTKKDIDLIIAMGTWAGKDLANNEHSVPTMVMSSTDPARAGIIASNEDSGYDHVFARVAPRRFQRQVRVFHDVIRFKKLGIAYENSNLGRTYAAIDLIEAVAKEKQFEIARCFTKDDIPDQGQAGESVIKCFEELAPQVDALYVVIQNGVNDKTLPKLVAIANKYRIPTFSQQGSDEVKKGILLSISREGGFGPVGRFLAISMAKIFNGAKPREINQVFEEGPALAINLKTAELIGLYLNAEILAAADEIYREIEN